MCLCAFITERVYDGVKGSRIFNIFNCFNAELWVNFMEDVMYELYKTKNAACGIAGGIINFFNCKKILNSRRCLPG